MSEFKRQHPLGAVVDAHGVHFSVFAPDADTIELCLFDANFTETSRTQLQKQPDGTWHVYMPGVRPDAVYGYRAYGTWAPELGFFFNPKKLLLDPYARSLTRNLVWHDSLKTSESDEDSAPYAPLAKVVHDAFDWQGDQLPRIPEGRTIIYEAHVRGLTMNFPGLAPALRGTYLGIADESVIHYLKGLGITTLELLPVHLKCDDQFLTEKGLVNYWGYSTLNFFIPEPRYAVAQSVLEFKTMVRALHHAGIEVILDVVYNHTAEMGHGGPALSFRGLAHNEYYLFENGRYVDHTGCGNTLNFSHPETRAMVLASLRYWAESMHVDGFRFDLAPALFREGGDPAWTSAFSQSIASDPVLSGLKLIAEPWDLGPNGYARAMFQSPWYVWNDRFRDAARCFWRHDGVSEALLRAMQDSSVVNYVTCHDGFTLRDLVSYTVKHNESNLEENRDGADENYSSNCGKEGDTDDVVINSVRLRQVKNLLATLLFGRGIPMLLAGDEIGHSQKGNNNAYCQDNEITHLAWMHADAQLGDFIREWLARRASFDWAGVQITGISLGNPHQLACALDFDSRPAQLVFMANASATSNAVVPLPDSAPGYRELLHTARAIRQETYAGVFVVEPLSVVVVGRVE